MKKIIIWVIGLAALAGVLFFASQYVSVRPAQSGRSGMPKIGITPNFFGFKLPFSNAPEDIAWDAFQKYLGFNKIRDLEGVKNSVYRISPVCEDPSNRIDCEARMAAAYSYGSALKKEDFTNLWSDEKQIILATDFVMREENKILGRNRAIIYFVKNESGGLKMLSFSPLQGVMVSNGTASEQEMNDRLVRYTEDEDQDGAMDYEEECLAVKEGEQCVKSDPKLRDSDGDGLWDGIEALMN